VSLRKRARQFIQFYFVPTASRVSRSANARRKIDRSIEHLVSPRVENTSINPLSERNKKRASFVKNVFSFIKSEPEK